MILPFRGSLTPSVGIENELMIVDRRTRGLVDRAPAILMQVKDHPWLGPRVKKELFQHTLEVITLKCESVPEAIDEQRKSIDLLSRLLPPEVMLASAGTHPFSRALDHAISEDERYGDFLKRYGIALREMQSFGVHVHIGVPDGEAALKAVNVGAMYAALILSLSASSPFVDGVDGGLQSSRKPMFEALGLTRLPRDFRNWESFSDYFATLVGSGVVKTLRDLWWHDRVNAELGTSEARAADAMGTLHETAAIAALKQCLVAPLSDRNLPDPLNVRGGEFRQLEDVENKNMWSASRDGLDAVVQLPQERTMTARDWARETVERLRPVAVALGCERELLGVHDILEWGNGADRQRAIIAAGGSALDVVDALAIELAQNQFVVPVSPPAGKFQVQAGARLSMDAARGVETRTVGRLQPASTPG
jgi:carboxylate-amine ligase